MEFEWDEAKCASNLRKHGLDFRIAVRLFADKVATAPARDEAGELRWMATAPYQGGYVTVIYTLRGNVLRIISLRRARDGERRRYQALFSH